MNRTQIVAVTSCAALCVALYLFAPTKKPEKPSETPTANTQTQQPESLDIDAYVAEITSKITEDSTKNKVGELQKSKNYRALAEAFSKLDKPIAVAYYLCKNAEVTNAATDWVQAGDYNAMLMQSAPDEKARVFLSENSINSYRNATNLDVSNTEYRIRLASAYMENGTQPMQGVSILLDIVKKDSNNVDAHMLLARFGIISGQFDKAIDRLEKILYLQPQNSEALLMLAEAYNNLGNKEKALKLLEQCKKTVKSPELKSQIDQYIQSIKKPS